MFMTTGPNRSIARQSAIVIVVLLAFAGIGAYIYSQREDPPPATETIHLGIHMEIGDRTASFQEGDTCRLAEDSSQQVTIADADQVLANETHPDSGTIRQGTDGAWYCSYTADVIVTSSPLYTFTVNKLYSEVVDRPTLQSTDWTMNLDWPAVPSQGPAATPVASPVATPGATPAPRS